MTGGAPMPVEVHERLRGEVQRRDPRGLRALGDLAGRELQRRSTSRARPARSAIPVWGVEMCIVDESDEPLPDGERGEICIRGHNIMKGYLNRPEAHEGSAARTAGSTRATSATATTTAAIGSSTARRT